MEGAATLMLDVRGRPLAVRVGREAGRYFACADLLTAHGAVTLALAVDEAVIHALAWRVADKLRAALGLTDDDAAMIWDALTGRIAQRYFAHALGGML